MAAGCHLAVKAVAVNMNLSLGTTRSLLMRRGLLRSTEKGLAFRETGSSCHGRGELYRDDRASRSNRNNKGGMLAWLMLGPCLSANAGHLRMGEMAAHEVGHTLGAVQWTSPNSSKHGHCVDTHDVMCYRDAATTRTRLVCPLTRPLLLDCRKNDYFNTAPRARSYLATRWNIARSAFLARTQPVAWDRLERPTAAITGLTAGSTVSGLVTIVAAATAPTGSRLDAVVFFVNGQELEADFSAPYEVTLDLIAAGVPDGAQLRLGVAAIDNYSRVGWSEEIAVTASNPAAQVAITTPAPASQIAGTVPVEVAVTPAPGTAVQSVELTVNGAVVDTDDTAPWTFQLDTVGLANGPATLTARALDDHGRWFSSPDIVVTVANTAPSISITAPTSGAIVTGPFQLVASVVAGSGSSIVAASFTADGWLLDQASVAPWSTPVDPAGLGYQAGDVITLGASLEDDQGRIVDAAPVAVTYQP
jgi:hypothetical protein